MSDVLPIISVFADESCLGNGREGDNPGGAGGLIQALRPRAGEPVELDYWLSEPGTTNNRMALRSAIEAFRIASARGDRFRVAFTSDSQYLVKGMTEWLTGWAQRGWRRKVGPIENLELWMDLVEASSPHEHRWRWVRGHAAHPQNEYANFLAQRAAREQTASPGAVGSGYAAWLSAEQARGRMTRTPDPFPPNWAAFTPGCRIPAGSRA